MWWPTHGHYPECHDEYANRYVNQLQATEEALQQMRADMAAAPTMSPSTTCADCQSQGLLSTVPPQVPDLPEDVRERVARRIKQWPIIVSTPTDKG